MTHMQGLSLLDLVSISFPSFDLLQARGKGDEVAWPLQSFLVGASSALIASPCSSPVLASLLTLVATLNPFWAASYLFSFSLGYATPVVAVVSGTVNIAESTAKKFEWVNIFFASILIAYGSYEILDGVF